MKAKILRNRLNLGGFFFACVYNTDMKRSYEIMLIILTNFIGFLSVPICFYTLWALGIVSEDFFATQSQISFQNWAAGILGVWAVCLLFSLAALMIKQKERIILMVAPAIIPIVYGFSILVIFGRGSF